MMRGVTLLAAALLTTGCVTVGVGESGQVQAQYRLEDHGTVTARAQPLTRTLLVTQLPSSGVGDVFSMAYSRAAQQRSFYQYATWADRPSQRVAQLLTERLDARRIFESVSMLGHGIGGNVLLNVTINELVHDVASAQARLEVTLELIDRSTRDLVARERFESTAPVAAENAPAAVAAMSRALSQFLDRAVPWVEKHAETLPPPQPRGGRFR